MAKKKEEDLELEDFQLDPELDFDFDSEIDGSFNQEALNPKERSPVTSVLIGAGTEVASQAINPQLYKNILARGLPETYGQITGTASEIVTSTNELYNQTVKELKPRLNKIFINLDKLVPANFQRTKKLLKAAEEKTGELNYGGAGLGNQTESAVQSVLGDVFQVQVAQDKVQQIRDVARDEVDRKRYNASTGISLDMRKDISTMAQYTVNVNQAWQRKSLELQVRSYFESKEFYSKSLELMKSNQVQNEAIVKNTALPEYSKIQLSERFLQRGKDRMIDKLYGSGSFVKQGFDRLKSSASEFTGSLAGNLDLLTMGMDGMVSQKETMDRYANDPNSGIQISKAEMMGAAAAQFLTDWVEEKAGNKLKKYVDEDNDILEKLAKYAKMANNPAGFLKQFREGDDWQDKLNDTTTVKGKAFNFLDFIMGHFGEDTPSRTYDTGNSLDTLDDPQEGFTKRAHVSLVDIIPGHLSHIHREIVMLRTGRDAPLIRYDYENGRFAEEREIQKILKDKLASGIRNSSLGSNLDSVLNTFTNDRPTERTMDTGTQDGVKEFFFRLSSEPNVKYDDLDDVKKTRAYQAAPDYVKQEIDLYYNEIASSEKEHQQSNRLSLGMKRLREETPSSSEAMRQMVKSGYGDLLAKEGLLKRDTDRQRFDVNEPGYQSLLESLTVRSDIHVKEDITPQTPKGLLDRLDAKIRNRLDPKAAFEGMKKTKLYSYFYKPGVGDGEEHQGPMAQDVRQQLGEAAAPKGRSIDLQTINGSFFAAIQYLGDRYDSLASSIKEEFSKQKAQAEQDKAQALASTAASTDEAPATSEAQDAAIPKHLRKAKGSRATKTHPVKNNQSELDYLKIIALNSERTYALLEDMVSGEKPIKGAGVSISGEGLFSTVSGIVGKLASTMGKTLSLGYNNILKPVGETVGNIIQKNKGGFWKGVGDTANWGIKQAGRAFDLAKDTVTNTIPNAIGWVKGKATDALKGISDAFQEYKDIYLPGGLEPVIRAVKIPSGFYRDEETGEPLLTFDDILKCKNNIVDKAGNLVLSIEDRAQGLFDRHGERIKSMAMKLGGLLANTGLYMFDKARKLVSGIFSGGIKGFEGLKSFFSEHSFGNFLKQGAGGIGDSKSYGVLVDIRDILLGEKQSVLGRLKTEADQAKAQADEKASAEIGPQLPLKVAAQRHAESLIDRFKGPSSAPELVGPTIPLITRAQRKLKDTFDTLKAQTQEAQVGPMMPTTVAWKRKAEALMGKQTASSKPELVGPVMPKGEQLKRGVQAGKASLFTLLEKLLKEKEANTDDQVAEVEIPAQDAAPQVSRLDKVKQFFTPKPKPEPVQGPAPELTGPPKPELQGPPRPEAPGKVGKLGKVLGGAKAIGKGLLGGAASLAGGLLGGSNTDTPADKAQVVQEGPPKPSLTTKVKMKLKRLGKSKLFNDQDGDGDRDGGVDDRNEKLKELQAKRNKGMLEADTTQRYGNESGIFGKLFDLASNFLGGIGGKITGLLGSLGGILSAVPGLGKIGAMAKSVFTNPVGSVLKTGATLFGKAITSSVGLAGRAALMVGGLGLNAVASVATTALSALASPVILGAAAIAGTAYGIYWLYKRANRNNASELERLRLRQYGFAYNSVVDRFNYMPYTLEAYLEDGRTGYSNISKQAFLLHKKIKPEELLEIFKINPEDKEKVEAFNVWLEKRFAPVYLNHMTALYKQDGKAKLSEVDKLSAEKKLAYLEDARLANNDAYKVDSGFVEGMASLDVNSDEINASFSNLIEKLRITAEQAAKKAAVPDRPKPPQTPEQKAAADQALAAKKPIEAPAPKPASTTVDTKKFEDVQLGDRAEGDGAKPTSQPVEDKAQGMNVKPIPKADGPMRDGTGGSQYIRYSKDATLNGMSPTVVKNFMAMVQEYGETTGKTVQVNDGKRTREQQAALALKYPGKAAKPGRSLHEFGLAIDINSTEANAMEKMGLMRKYGFTRPMGQEPWHMEPALIQKSIDKAKLDPNAAEEMAELSKGRGGGGYGTMPNAEKYRRNHGVAMAALSAADKSVTPQAEGSVSDDKALTVKAETKEQTGQKVLAQEKPKSLADTTKDLTQAKTTAANDPSLSKASQIPAGPPKALAAKPSEPDSEGEKTPSLAATGKAGNPDVKAVIEKSAKRVGVDPGLLTTFAAIESSMDPNARAPNSRARGLMQFMPETWEEQLGKHGKKYNLSANTSPFDAEASSLLGGEYVKSNMKVISTVKENPGVVEAYMAHLLGAGGARIILSAPPDAIAAELRPDAAKAQRRLFYSAFGQPFTVRQFYDKIAKEVKTKASAFGINVPTSGLGLKPGTGEPGGLKPGSDAMLPETAAPATPAKPAPTVTTKASPPPAAKAFSFDDRSPASKPAQSGAAQTSLSVNMGNMETLMGKLVEIQSKSNDYLKEIAQRLSPEEMGKLAVAFTAAVPKAESKEEATKRKDQVNMGRTVNVEPSSLDLRRKAS